MRYLGGKTKLSKYLVPIIQKVIDTYNYQYYIEPFCGGCNVIDKVRCSTRVANDSNEYLIAMWKALQTGWVPPDVVTKEEYDYIRYHQDEFPSHYLGFVGFASSFGGKWFGGYAQGDGRNFSSEGKRVVLKQINTMKDVQFSCFSFDRFIGMIDMVLYCDPPYANTTKYKDGFDHEHFWDWVRKQDERNTILISEYNAPEDFLPVFEMKQKVSVSRDSSKYKVATEKLFIHRSNSEVYNLLTGS